MQKRGKANCGTSGSAPYVNARSCKADGNKSSADGAENRGTRTRKNCKGNEDGSGARQTLDVERSHHPYSPSWLQSGEACPCYRSVDSKHERTIAGTIAHKASEKQEDDDRLSDDDAISVAGCLDFYDARKRELKEIAREAYSNCHLEEFENDLPPTPESEFTVIEGSETYLPIDDLVFPDCKATTAGYADRWLYVPALRYAEIIDWKFGKWPVEEASNNLQGMAYAMGIFRKFPNVESVRVFFKQPLISYLTSHTFTRAYLVVIYLRIQTIVATARLARVKCEAGDWSDAKPAYPLCNFCANLGKCSKVLEFACQVGHKFHPLGIPAAINPSLIQDPQNTKLAMELASTLKIWCDAFKRQVNDRVIRGDAVIPDGYVLQTIQKREMVDLSKYREAALRFLSQSEWEACLDTTFSDVEKK